MIKIFKRRKTVYDKAPKKVLEPITTVKKFKRGKHVKAN